MDHQNIESISKAFVQLFRPFCEVIIHNLASGTVSNVIGEQSTREIGEPSYLEGLDKLDLTKDIHGPYRKTTPDGRSIKSISIIIRNSDGTPEELLCINTDLSQFETARVLLSGFTSVLDAETFNPLANDWLEGLHVYISTWSLDKGIQIKNLQSITRRELVYNLEKNGVFNQKNAAQAVAKALGVSRATIYQDLRHNKR